MKLPGSLLLCLLAASGASAQSFDEVIARAGLVPRKVDIPVPGRGPSLRFETSGDVLRTQDFFFQSPYENRSVAAVVAFDYPLLDGGSRALAARTVRLQNDEMHLADQLPEAYFDEILDAYVELWLAGEEAVRTRALAQRGETLTSRASARLADGAISNLTAAQWEESALLLRTLSLDVELRQQDARAKLHALVTGDVVPEIDTAAVPQSVEAAVDHHPEVMAARLRLERAQLAEALVENRRRPAFFLSGYGGLGAADSRFLDQDSNGSFGIYGFRLRMTLTLRDAGYGSELLRARNETARLLEEKERMTRRVAARLAAERQRMETQGRRIELLEASLQVSRNREDSIGRLVDAGVQPELEALRASIETLSRAGRLDAARVERWKAWQRLRRLDER